MIVETIIVGGVVISAILIRTYQNKKKKDAEIQAMLESLVLYGKAMTQVAEQNADAYQEEPVDHKLECDCSIMLKGMFPNGIRSKFESLATEYDRQQLITELIKRTCEILQVDVRSVVFEELPVNVGGSYSYGHGGSEKKITINRVYLIEDPEKLLHIIFHELKHAVQYESVLEDNKWGYTAQRRAQWLKCMDDKYVDYCYEAYALQSIEIDAEYFAEGVFKNYNN